MAYPTTPLTVVIEFWDGTQWVDITGYVLVRDGIHIFRGFRDEGSSPEPGSMTLTLNNRDGRFSPRNPTSPYYGLIGRNTPMRVSVDESFIASGDQVRFVGEVSEWPARWDISGRDVWVPVTVQGILRRLGQGAPPLQSAIKSTVLASNPVAYWPLEDGLNAIVAGSGVAGAAPMRVVGIVDFAQDDTLPGSRATPDLSEGSLFASVSGGSASAWYVEMWMRVDSTTQSVGRIYSGPDRLWRLFWPSGADTFDVFITDAAGGTLSGLISTTVFGTSFTEAWHHIAVTAEQNGGNVNASLYIDGVLEDTASFADTLLPVSEVWANHQDSISDNVIFVSHVAVGDGVTPSSSALAGDGYAGETAADRADRLTADNGVPFVLVGSADDTEPMGPQAAQSTFADAYNETWLADLALAYETRDSIGLDWRSRVSLYNQAVGLELDYEGAGEVAGLEPTDDDQHVRNDITVNRTNGSSARAVDSTSLMGTQDPPLGIGRYETSVELNLFSDDQCSMQAAWRLHVGHWDALRYPAVSINMAALAAAGETSLMADVAALDVGDRIRITGLPAWLPPDNADLMVLGFVEPIGHPVEWGITLMCVPYGPYDVGTLASDTDEGRLNTRGCVTSEALDATETGVDVTNDDGGWSNTAEPYDIVIGGERMTVTDGGTPGTSQTLTVTRSVNGVVKSHSVGAAVTLVRPLRLVL